MEARNMTFPGGVVVGAGLMYLLDPERTQARSATLGWTSGLQCLAGILGVAAVAYGARFIARRARRDDLSPTTAFDLDVPNYAWLR